MNCFAGQTTTQGIAATAFTLRADLGRTWFVYGPLTSKEKYVGPLPRDVGVHCFSQPFSR